MRAGTVVALLPVDNCRVFNPTHVFEQLVRGEVGEQGASSKQTALVCKRDASNSSIGKIVLEPESIREQSLERLEELDRHSIADGSTCSTPDRLRDEVQGTKGR